MMCGPGRPGSDVTLYIMWALFPDSHHAHDVHVTKAEDRAGSVLG